MEDKIPRPLMMGSGSTAPEQGNRGQGSYEAQDQGSSVPRWAHQASINRLVPTVPIECSPLGTSTLGRRGGANLRVGHAWMTLDPGSSPTALLTHVWLVMTIDHFNKQVSAGSLGYRGDRYPTKVPALWED